MGTTYRAYAERISKHVKKKKFTFPITSGTARFITREDITKQLCFNWSPIKSIYLQGLGKSVQSL